jgi:hypothetical protein
MSYGIRILQSDGQTFDETIAAVTFVGLYSIGADAVGSIPFPALAGREVIVSRGAISATAFGMHYANVSYDAGYPVVNYGPTGGPAPHTSTQLMVFAR